MSEKGTKPLVEQATEWLSQEPGGRLNRWEIICALFLFAVSIWWLARLWGWHEGMADAVGMQAQARRDELESWRERARHELREDVAAGVRTALDTYERHVEPDPAKGRHA
jgi:hypothetical protein